MSEATNKLSRRPSGFVPFGGLGRKQSILGTYYPPLWAEVEAKWIPTARPISQANIDNTGDYSRQTLASVLCSLEEWDGFEVCAMLKTFYGWHPDAALVGIIHRWSCSLAGKLAAKKPKAAA